jgi:hypothetical protein
MVEADHLPGAGLGHPWERGVPASFLFFPTYRDHRHVGLDSCSGRNANKADVRIELVAALTADAVGLVVQGLRFMSWGP